MGDSINTRLVGDTKDRFEDYLKDNDGTSAYEASRELIDEGLRRRGYHPNETPPKSRLQHSLSRLATGFAIAGLILTGMSFSGNPGVQTYTLAVFAVAFVLQGANHLGDVHLDELLDRLRGRGDDA
jgi:hypothetical protein